MAIQLVGNMMCKIHRKVCVFVTREEIIIFIYSVQLIQLNKHVTKKKTNHVIDPKLHHEMMQISCHFLPCPHHKSDTTIWKVTH